MIHPEMFAVWCVSLYVAAVDRVRGENSERGDVPGWVMVTVMTAGLVVAVFAVFKGKITGAISDAIDSVSSGTK